MDLVRDVLDKQLLGSDDERMGKVDGIVLSLRPGQPPRVAFLETGPSVLARRLGRRLGGWVESLERRCRIREGPLRIEWSRVRSTGVEVRVEVEARKSSAFAFERWLRERVIRRMPGGKG